MSTAARAPRGRRWRLLQPVLLRFLFYDPWYRYLVTRTPYPYGYGYRTYEPEASVRLEVKPKEAEVYVDGFYAGIVDDFDGTFQRLRVPPGEHELELWLEGYRTVRQKVF